MRKIRLLLWFAATTAVAVFGALYIAGLMNPEPAGEEEKLRTADEIAREIVTGEFSLIDHRGVPVTDEDFRGSWPLVFFGYTHCPDVCPTALGTVGIIMDELGADAAAVQPLFITIDPSRDTPEIMADYVGSFHSRMIGLTGSEEQVAAAARSHRAYYAKVLLFEGDQVRTDDYAMDHSALLYLMDPDGMYAAAFSPVDTVENIVKDIREFVNR